MNIAALMTSAGINIGLCILFFSLYSILRKQPVNFSVYFPRKLAEDQAKCHDSFSLERLVPSASWIKKAWELSEQEILAAAGLDAVVFIRIYVLSMRIFALCAVLCIFILLPVNYYGNQLRHINITHIPFESLDAFTISNVQHGSKRLWAHFCALYLISCASCCLLYFEYKGIAAMRLAYFNASPPQPNHFTILVRGIPKSEKHSLSDSVKEFFMHCHPLTYHSHQMVYRTGRVQALMNKAEKLYEKIVHMKSKSPIQKQAENKGFWCCSGANLDPIELHTKKLERVEQNAGLGHSEHFQEAKEVPAAFVSFKSRYAAVIASQIQQSSNPMLWITELAPEPQDVYWSHLAIPYRQLWFRKIAILLAAIAFTILFIIPVTIVQSLAQLEQLQQVFPFLKKILRTTVVSQLVTGYFPSLILQLFLLIVAPAMKVLSAMQGSISYSGNQKSTCIKVLYFTIWNVFFVNVLSGSVINQINTFISSPKDIPTRLARVVPSQGTFFITYVLTSGWTSLSSEIMQLVCLIWNFFKRCFSKSAKDVDLAPSFPYHQEIPKVLFFGLLGFIWSVLAPLILPFLLVYFSLGYIVYRNQVMNVYCFKYETGGQYWPIVHNCTIFSMVMMQIVAMGVFGLKEARVASTLIIPLVVSTLLFNEYCRKRFSSIFKSYSAEILINKDREDEQSGQLENFLQNLDSAYRHPTLQPVHHLQNEISKRYILPSHRCLSASLIHPAFRGLQISRIHEMSVWLTMILAYQERRVSR